MEKSITKKRDLSKNIFFIAIPVMIQTLSEYLLNIVDTAFIGHYNIKGVSAITNALYPYFIILSFLFATSRGTSILIAQSIGAKDYSKARRYQEVSYIFNQIISLFYFIFWIFAGKFIISILGAKKEILDMAYSYLFIINFHFLFFGFALSSNASFEGKGITTPIMIVSVLKNFLNIFLDWVLIFGKLGFPEMGINGAALATLISQTIAGFVIIYLSFNNKNYYKIRIKGILRPDFKLYIKSFKLGFPNGIDFMAWVLGQNLLIFLLNRLNQLAAGIFSIFGLIMSLTVNLYVGISLAALNLVGKATGANNPVEAKRYGKLCIFYSLLICMAASIIFILFPAQILGIFTKDISIFPNIQLIMILISLITFPTAVNVVAGNAIRGTGNTMWMVITQIPGTIVIFILAYVFIFVLKLGITGILFALFIDELWRGIANFIKFYYFSFNIPDKK